MSFANKKNIARRKSVISLVTWMTVFFLSCLHTTYAQDGYEIKRIRFKGNETFDKEDLMPNLSMYELSFMQRIRKKKEPYLYNQEFINNDLERLIRFYQREGFIYVQAKIDTINTNTKKRTVDVQFDIQEGKPTLVDSISLNVVENDSITKLLNRSRLRRRLALKENEPFSDAAINEDIFRINKMFQSRGYAYSETSYQLKIDTAANTTSVQYNTQPNTRSIFGETSITGHKYTRDRFVRRQIPYSAGERYDASKLDQVRKNLYDLQLFRVISVHPNMNPNEPQKPIPVDIVLEEMPRVSSVFGVGYGTEDKFRAFVDLTYRGIFKDATRLNLYFKHSALEPYHISLKLIQPQFLDKKTSLSINPYLLRQKEPGYDIQVLGLSVPLNRKFSDDLNMALTYYYENVALNVDAYQLDPEEVSIESGKYIYSKSGLQFNASYSNALPRFSPVRGFSAMFGVKFNGYIFPSSFNYTRTWLDMRKYHQFKGFTLALRGMIGGIQAQDTIDYIPVEDRFYSGGSNSIRGWGRSMLGPVRDSKPPTPLGGNSVIELSAELRHRLFWQLDGAVFVDMGNVWSKSYHYPLNDLAYSAGVGLRYKTPIGPIRFDVSMPLWNEKRKPQFFLSIGQAF